MARETEIGDGESAAMRPRAFRAKPPGGVYASELLMLENELFTAVAMALMPVMSASAIKEHSNAYSTKS